MMQKASLLNQLIIVSQSRMYWLLYIIGGISSMAFALYFQHAMDELPCLLCIQIRLLVSLLIIVSMLAFIFSANRIINAISHISVVSIAIALTERCYQLLGTERGFVFGDCGFDLGLPAWFNIEQWLPWLYRVETPCGYTPEIIFGITMAEALMVMSVLFLLLSFCVAVTSFVSTKTRD